MASLFTYQQFLDSRWPARVGLCATDARLLSLFNEAQRRLVAMPARWVGTVQQADLYINHRTWFCVPPGATTILAAYNADTRGRGELLNGWYQFGGIADYSGPGSLATSTATSDQGILFLSESGVSAVVSDLPDEPFTVRAYANFAVDVGVMARVYGSLPFSNLPVTSQAGLGVGLPVSDRDATVYETPTVGRVTLIEKPKTAGPIDFYAAVADGGELFIQQMAAWETNSIRQKWVVNTRPVPCYLRAILKLGHVPLTVPTDFAVIASLDAMGTMVLALKRYEERAYEESKLLEADALKILDDATRDLTGDRVTINSRGHALKSRMAAFI
jgi:hypothetical protein